MGTLEGLKAIKLELEEKIKQAEKDLKAEHERRRSLVQREWKFTFLPVENRDRFDEVWDEACQYFQLRGEVLNADECLAAGHGPDFVKGGAMNYLVNKINGRLIQRSGGGTLFLNGEGGFGSDRKEELKAVIRQLETFLIFNPLGGDVTSIIVNQPNWNWGVAKSHQGI